MTDPLIPPTIPSAEELYNSLMHTIEPELITHKLPSLKERYTGESKEEEKSRMERYTKAFTEYDQALAQYIATLQEQVSAFRKKAYGSAEDKTRENEQQQLSEMESTLFS